MPSYELHWVLHQPKTVRSYRLCDTLVKWDGRLFKEQGQHRQERVDRETIQQENGTKNRMQDEN